ncbi:MAG TPA: extracellular solute-binding protein [Candidatus Mediterraneibacter pullicola]|uniref:Extracellular solute-binding protein n=1 Tax=Candidatus Mediterraneibacter pullicola TaxID=2838682 RepID=A0A9D2H9R1_9FIRM|nr:extracellular solute-binding protein [Candidatus Mediterraneibacter pullicola]
MKKRQIAAALLAGAMLVSVTACGTGGDNSASGGDSSGGISITIPSYKTGENVGAVFFEPQVERFNEKYEGTYHIELENVAEDAFNDQIKQLAQQDALPALVQGGDKEWLKTVAFPNGMAYDLSGWLDETPEIKDLLLADGIDYCTSEDGAIYSMPLATVRPTGFFYNTALWDTQEDLSAMTMDDFTTALGDQKIAFSTAENAWVTALFWTALIANEEGGAEILNSGIDEKITDFNQPVILDSVTKLQSLLQNNASSNSVGAAYPDTANTFMSSGAAVIANGPWMSTDFEETNSSNWSNDFDGANVRASLFPGQVGIAQTRTYGEWWISSSASEEEVELALAFLEFINSPEELEAYLLAEGGDAPNLEYTEDFVAQQGETQVLADLAADTTEETVYVPCILDVIPSSVANSDLSRLLPSLADGTYTPEQFCEQLSTAAAEATAQ